LSIAVSAAGRIERRILGLEFAPGSVCELLSDVDDTALATHRRPAKAREFAEPQWAVQVLESSKDIERVAAAGG
jgi:hypothetical protein